MLTFPARIYGTPNEFIYFHVTGDRIRESIFGSIFSRCLYRWLQYDRGVYRLLLHTRPVHHLLAGDSGCISLARISPQHPDGRYTFPFSFGLWCVGLTNFFCSVHFTLWLTSYPSSHLNKFVRLFKIRCVRGKTIRSKNTNRRHQTILCNLHRCRVPRFVVGCKYLHYH